ncbi:fkbM_fam, methyltransferase, FkbM family [Candidatus Nanopelagicaceae bacterium]
MGLLKRYVKKRVKPLVWNAMANAKIEYRLSKLSHHINEELKKELGHLISMMPGQFEKYYLDVGAHDGRTHSNTYHLDHQLHWSGILVEPILHLTFMSRKTRSNDRNLFINAACVGPDFQSDSIKLLYCDLMTLAPEISENSGEEWVTGGSQYLPENQFVVETYAAARTVKHILENADSPTKIGVFSIDVEGAELEVLKGVDFERYSFGIIILETAIQSAAYEYLIAQGYFFYRHIGQNQIFLNDTFKFRSEKFGKFN